MILGSVQGLLMCLWLVLYGVVCGNNTRVLLTHVLKIKVGNGWRKLWLIGRPSSDFCVLNLIMR